jgi:hypothetical protein
MTAVTKNTDTVKRDGYQFSAPVKAADNIFQGAMVGIDSANLAIDYTSADAVACLGVAEFQANNSSGADGDLMVETRKGTQRFVNGDSIVLSDIGKDAYALDNITITKAANGIVIGTIADVDAKGVWITFK